MANARRFNGRTSTNLRFVRRFNGQSSALLQSGALLQSSAL